MIDLPDDYDHQRALQALRAENAALKKRLRVAFMMLTVAERLVNDNPKNGPGAPHVPGLTEIRDTLTTLRRPLPKARKS